MSILSMHFKFERKLIINEIMGKPPKGSSIQGLGYMIRSRHIRLFLIQYFETHRKLPTGCHDLAKLDKTCVKIGVVDFDDIKMRISEDLKYKDFLNYNNWIESGGISKFQMSREFMVGFREQASGNNPNEIIYNMRQRLAHRKRAFTTH